MSLDLEGASGARIGRAVAVLRKARGLSAQKLSDRCTELGYPIAQSTIANIESGRKRDIPVREVIAFAAALNVPVRDLVPALRGREYLGGYEAGLAAARDAIDRLAEA